MIFLQNFIIKIICDGNKLKYGIIGDSALQTINYSGNLKASIFFI